MEEEFGATIKNYSSADPEGLQMVIDVSHILSQFFEQGTIAPVSWPDRSSKDEMSPVCRSIFILGQPSNNQSQLDGFLCTTLTTWRPNEKSGEQWLWSLHLFCGTSAAHNSIRLSMVSYNAVLGSCTKAGNDGCEAAQMFKLCAMCLHFLVVLYFLKSFTVSIPWVPIFKGLTMPVNTTVCLSFLMKASISNATADCQGAGLKT